MPSSDTRTWENLKADLDMLKAHCRRMISCSQAFSSCIEVDTMDDRTIDVPEWFAELRIMTREDN